MADRPRRPGTNADHDRFARISPALGVPVAFEGQATGVLEGPALAAVREQRADKERIARLEQRADEHDRRDVELAAMLGTVGGELADLGKGLAAVSAIVQDRGRRPSGGARQVEEVVKTTLADRVLAKDEASARFRQRLALTLASGTGALVLWLLQHFLGGH